MGVRINAEKHWVCSDQFDSVVEQIDGRGMFYEVYNNISLGLVYTFGTTKARIGHKKGKTKPYWY